MLGCEFRLLADKVLDGFRYRGPMYVSKIEISVEDSIKIDLKGSNCKGRSCSYSFCLSKSGSLDKRGTSYFKSGYDRDDVYLIVDSLLEFTNHLGGLGYFKSTLVTKMDINDVEVKDGAVLVNCKKGSPSSSKVKKYKDTYLIRQGRFI